MTFRYVQYNTSDIIDFKDEDTYELGAKAT